MFIKILKILTSLFLVVLLFTLTQKRDFLLPLTKIPLTKKTSAGDQISVPSTPKQEMTDTSIVKSSLSTTTNKIKQPVSLSPQAPKQAPLPKIAVSLAPNVYEPLREEVSDTNESYRPVTSPCNVPMGYKLGIFDSRFDISKTAFLQEVKKGSDIWGEAIGKNLFYYDENGPLTINLIYDERQAKTTEVNYLALEIENSKNVADQIHQRYEQEKAIYLFDGESFTKDGENFQLRYKIYFDKVAASNQAGGAQKAEYDALTYELDQLKKEAAALEARRVSFVEKMESINAKVLKYNELTVYINSLIKKSNALGSNKFTEGRFSPNSNTIDIYQYNNDTKLLRVLTHELGHVLGINHNKNIYSIMYTSNSATTTSLSKEDLQALTLVCPSH